MDCVQAPLTDTIQASGLLTQIDKKQALESALKKYHPEKGIFLPDDEFYTDQVTPETVKSMVGQIFRYLGIKHRSLAVRTDSQQTALVSYVRQGRNSELIFGLDALKDPFICGAAVAHGVVHHLLVARSNIQTESASINEELTDLATLQLGLGVLIINSFASTPVLGAMHPDNYLAEALDYLHDQQIVPSMWQPYVLPELLLKYRVTTNLPPVAVASIQSLTAKQTKHRQKLRLGFAVAIVSLASVWFWSALAPHKLSAEMLNRRENITVLRRQYETCELTVKQKLETWDRTNIFMERQIEEDKLRCTSLRNRHNYEVSEYNARLPKN